LNDGDAVLLAGFDLQAVGEYIGREFVFPVRESAARIHGENLDRLLLAINSYAELFLLKISDGLALSVLGDDAHLHQSRGGFKHHRRLIGLLRQEGGNGREDERSLNFSEAHLRTLVSLLLLTPISGNTRGQRKC
jgi:hypothetical protein